MTSFETKKKTAEVNTEMQAQLLDDDKECMVAKEGKEREWIATCKGKSRQFQYSNISNVLTNYDEQKKPHVKIHFRSCDVNIRSFRIPPFPANIFHGVTGRKRQYCQSNLGINLYNGLPVT